MKKFLTYISLFLFIVSCGGEENGEYTIKGTGIEAGTVFLFGADNEHKQLMSTKSDGSFSITVPLEQPAMLILILPDNKTVTLFAEPDITATLHADTTLQSGWSVKGGKAQALHDSVSRALDTAGNGAAQRSIIESFAKSHPGSEVNVELFRRYLINIPNPDIEYIKKNIKKLSGTLHDHWYFANIMNRLEKKTGDLKHRMFPSFSYTTIDGGKADLGTFVNKYLLVTFWGTWNKSSREAVKELRHIKERIKSENFAILNIALDYDTAMLKKIIESDSITGCNVYDMKGMNSELVENFNISSLPYSVLVTPYKRIAEYDLKLDSTTIELIDSLTQKHDKK